MPTTIELKAVRRSTFALTFAFDDPPTTLFWILTDLTGNVINNRGNEEITTPTATVTITLEGPDLDFYGSDEMNAAQVGRRLIVHGTYDSSLGSDLDLVEFAEFSIINVPGIN